MIRVLIADDHAVVRRGLKQILGDTDDLIAAGEAANGMEVLRCVRAEPWDVLVLDLNMPAPSGVELIQTLRSEKPGLPILVMSMYPEDQFAARVLKAGASGYLTKDSAPEDLVRAIRKVCSGGTFISTSFAEQLAVGLKRTGQDLPDATLTDREFEVLRRIASGESLTRIGRELGLSIKTISTYRHRLLQKLNLKSDADLVRYAVDHRLVD